MDSEYAGNIFVDTSLPQAEQDAEDAQTALELARITGDFSGPGKADLRNLVNYKTVRIMHFLQIVERHMAELNRMVDNAELEGQLEQVSELTASFERKFEAIVSGKQTLFIYLVTKTI